MTNLQTQKMSFLTDFISYFKHILMTTQNCKHFVKNFHNSYIIQRRAEVNQHKMQTQAEQWKCYEKSRLRKWDNDKFLVNLKHTNNEK